VMVERGEDMQNDEANQPPAMCHHKMAIF
jgi:hypothetical protein